jgi:hypothetical protein
MQCHWNFTLYRGLIRNRLVIDLKSNFVFVFDFECSNQKLYSMKILLDLLVAIFHQPTKSSGESWIALEIQFFLRNGNISNDSNWFSHLHFKHNLCDALVPEDSALIDAILDSFINLCSGKRDGEVSKWKFVCSRQHEAESMAHSCQPHLGTIGDSCTTPRRWLMIEEGLSGSNFPSNPL